MKYLGIDWAKYIQDLYIYKSMEEKKCRGLKLPGKLKTLQRLSKQDLSKCRNTSCSWITSSTLLKCQFSPK